VIAVRALKKIHEQPSGRVAACAFACCLVACFSGLVLVPVASAEGLSPWWGLTAGERPSDMVSGGVGQIVVTAENLGDGSAKGESEPVTIVDHLPAGLHATAITGVAGENVVSNNRGLVTCVRATLTCTFANELPSYEEIEVRITVEVQSGATTGELNTATVSGGGAGKAVSAQHAIEVDGPEVFGIEEYSLVSESVGGSIDTQAGSHPFQLTSVVTLNSQTEAANKQPRTFAQPKDIIADLPAGLVGNPTPFAQCTDEQFEKGQPGHEPANDCPAQAAVGVATITVNDPIVAGYATTVQPIFNMRPLAGEPARFAFKVDGTVPVYLDTSVRTGGDYGVTVSAKNLTQIAWFISAKLTFWGVPGDPRHDPQRGWECMYRFGQCPASTSSTPPPFLVLPTSCEQPFASTGRSDSWGSSEHPAETAEPVTYQLPEAVDGCNHLPFSPSLTVAPDIADGSSPTGLTVGVHVPQEAALNPEGLAQSTLKDTTVTLPEGLTLNPAGADGLQACSEAQIGFTGIEPGGLENDLFTAGLPEPFCPDAAKIGTVKIKTPLLVNPLEGAVYLGAQEANPFGSLIAMYLVARDPVSGTLIKLAGEVKPDPVTGRLVTTFKNTPELPFEDLELHFFGGERAPLSTPAFCGSYATTASFTPWSGNSPAQPEATFNIASGPNGSPCAKPLPFSPSLTAGTTGVEAGAFSPFTMTMSREDGQQGLRAISMHLPPGLSGMLAGVELCPEPQASQGLCGLNSLIGETTVSVGLGGDPFSVKGGRVYITGPYEGAPFGLSIVNPAKAGPFDLEKDTPCDCVLVRARIEVDPISAQLTVTSDNTGPYKIPTTLKGIPLEIKHVNVTINGVGGNNKFTFNPTNCNPLNITGAIDSTEGVASPVSAPFKVHDCATLKFAPKFAVTTSAKTSKANGASLNVKLTYPPAPFGSQANIKQVKVELPKALPSRLTTLQKACTSAQFNANPAGCPVASIIGHARAITPLLPVPLEGPAYFVSHGGEAFPSLIMVLQGYGVTLDLVGTTFISKAGITSSTFRTVPDAPVGLFELNLPQRPYSALTANGNLCSLTKTILVKKKVTVKVKGRKKTLTRKVKRTKPETLTMPTEFVAQNGATLHQSTPVNVTGCPKAKKAAKRKTAKPKKAKR
jgi:hypothetical protein